MSKAFYIGGGRQSLVGAPKAEPSNSINLLRFFLNRLIAISTLCLPAGGAFFSLLAQRKETKEKAALALRLPRSPRRGTGGAITRCAQTVCPFIRLPTSPPGSAPTASVVPEYTSTKQAADRRGDHPHPWPPGGKAQGERNNLSALPRTFVIFVGHLEEKSHGEDISPLYLRSVK